MPKGTGLILLAILGRGPGNTTIALTIVRWATFARMARATALFGTQARARGCQARQVTKFHAKGQRHGAHQFRGPVMAVSATWRAP